MGNRNRDKGNNYERQVAQELRELGFKDTVTSRYASKETDDNKIDLVFQEKSCPLNIQLKKTANIPQYFKIRSESNSNPEAFCLIWNKQEKKNKNFCSVGECVIIDKKLFYKLIKTQYIMENKEMNTVDNKQEVKLENAKVVFSGDSGEVVITFTLNPETNQLDYNVNTDNMKESDKLSNFLADTFMSMLMQMNQDEDPSEQIEETTEKE